ncbi:hypothetical protein, partial [Arthrobacter sp. HLT1-20]
GAASLPRPELPGELVLEVDMPTPLAAEFALGVPGVERTGDRTVRRRVQTVSEVLGLINVNYELAASAMRSKMVVINRR